jgi:hypothetical protein
MFFSQKTGRRRRRGSTIPGEVSTSVEWRSSEVGSPLLNGRGCPVVACSGLESLARGKTTPGFAKGSDAVAPHSGTRAGKHPPWFIPPSQID